jgi:tryptophan synthase alpha chain
VIELGMPFTDPMADGPSIQGAALRALDNGMTLKGTLKIAKTFRANHPDTPLVLMGYANPVHHMGYAAFAKAAADAGVDGLICVDLPPEEDTSCAKPSRRKTSPSSGWPHPPRMMSV